MVEDSKPGLDKLHILDDSGHRRYIFPADVSGRFARARSFVFTALILVYLGIPWVKVGGKPIVLLDISNRSFYLFGFVFNAQDIYLAFFILSGAVFFLVVLTTLLGRVWCGWLCPQTVFIEGVFRKIERLIEGPALARMKLNNSPWTLNKLAKKLSKHLIYLFVSSILAMTLMFYFNYSNKYLVFLFFFIVLYFNFFWFREQFCIIMCPYGRMQSVLQDQDTLNINYDKIRGEPRGKKSVEDVGDCINCGRCVAVCPTGIDIRNGLQMECIGCANCVDACDAIMKKLKRPIGLIRYDSLRGLGGEKRKYFRPRLLAYLFAGAVGFLVAGFAFNKHMSFEANLVRIPGAPYKVIDQTVQSQFMLHLVNKNHKKTTLEITNSTEPGIKVLIPISRVELKPLAGFQAPILFEAPKSAFETSRLPIQLIIKDSASETEMLVKGVFIGPKNYVD